MSIKVNFLGQTDIPETDKGEVKTIKNQWNQFAAIVMLLLIVKILLDYFGSSNLVLYFSISILATIIMIVTISYYAYKFSGKKITIIYGILGLVWIGYLGIAAGYLVVKRYADTLEAKASS